MKFSSLSVFMPSIPIPSCDKSASEIQKVGKSQVSFNLLAHKISKLQI